MKLLDKVICLLIALTIALLLMSLFPSKVMAEDFCWTDTGENHIYCKVEKTRIWLEPIGWTKSFVVSDKYIADDDTTFYLLLLK